MISYDELKERGWVSDEGLRLRLKTSRDSDALLLYQNSTFDSSAFGSMSIVIVGPDRTFSEDDPPAWIDYLPSQREQLVGRIDVEDVKARLELLSEDDLKAGK